MQVYTNTDLTGATIPPRQVTVGSKTVGCIITNYSNIGFNLNTDSNANLGTLPPYFSMNVSVNPGDVIYFNETSIATSALPQPSMFVTLAESQQPLSAGVTALAIVPGYQLTTTGTVSFAPGQEVAIQGTPTVQFAAGQQVNIGNVPNVAISSGTVTATISNAEIPANVVNANININPGIKGVTISFPISNLAAGATVYYQGAILATICLIDELWFFVNSSQLLTQSYGNFNLVELIRSDISYGLKGFNQIGDIQAINQYEQTVKFTGLDFPADSLRLGITNTSASTIVSDTLTLNFYAKYASQNVTNNSQNTLKMIPFAYSGGPGPVVPANNVELLAAGSEIFAIVYDLNLSGVSGSGANVVLSNGNGAANFSDVTSSVGQPMVHQEIKFGSGVLSEGIYMTFNLYTNATGSVNGYILYV